MFDDFLGDPLPGLGLVSLANMHRALRFRVQDVSAGLWPARRCSLGDGRHAYFRGPQKEYGLGGISWRHIFVLNRVVVS